MRKMLYKEELQEKLCFALVVSYIKLQRTLKRNYKIIETKEKIPQS
jgi:hypothetical protein